VPKIILVGPSTEDVESDIVASFSVAPIH